MVKARGAQGAAAVLLYDLGLASRYVRDIRVILTCPCSVGWPAQVAKWLRVLVRQTLKAVLHHCASPSIPLLNYSNKDDVGVGTVTFQMSAGTLIVCVVFVLYVYHCIVLRCMDLELGYASPGKFRQMGGDGKS